jgi:hypothetical protein
MEYGVQTHNKFAFLDEDVSDPVETLTKAEEEKKKAAAIPQKKISKPPVSAAKTTAVQRGGVPVGRDGKGNGVRDRNFRQGDQRRPRSDEIKEEKNVSNPVETLTKAEEDKKAATVPNKKPFSAKPLGNQRGGVPGGRVGKGNGAQDRTFRQRDQRRPRSDENNEDKKESKNAVEITDDKPFEDPFAPNGKIDGDQKDNNENVENTVPNQEEKQDDVVPEEQQVPRGKTYEEWKAEMNKKSVEAVQFKTRQAGEGVDEKIYQKLVPLKMDKKAVVEAIKKQEEFQDEITQHKEKREKTLPIDVAFADKRSTYIRQEYGEGRAYGGGGDRQGQKGGPRGQGPRGGGYRNNFGGAGTSRRTQGKQDGFMLESDQFPAL